MSRTSDEHARELATGEGLLGADVLALPVSRWPRWSRVRYAGDDDCAECLRAAAANAGTDSPRRRGWWAVVTAEPAQERLDGARGLVPAGGTARRTGALSGPSVSVRPPGSFVLGDKAVVSGRAAAWLSSRQLGQAPRPGAR